MAVEKIAFVYSGSTAERPRASVPAVEGSELARVLEANGWQREPEPAKPETAEPEPAKARGK
jgi:hypothetical protein